MLPKHLKKVPEDRKAIAPYNFVELPNKVVEAEQQLLSGDRYHSNCYTGKIECTLTTESPLYIRCGMTPQSFEKYSEFPKKSPPEKMTKEKKEKWDEEDKKKKQEWEAERRKILSPFFTYQSDNLPILPGSSLRGMLRTLVEIVSFSKIDRVSGEHRLFFRAVAANKNKESLGKEYKKYVEPERILAGYLKKDDRGWYIQPAMKNQDVTFAWVQEDELTGIPGFNKFDDDGYKPQYFKISYQSLEKREEKRNGKVIAQRWFARNIHLQEIEPSSKLVTSGNMKQGDESSPRCNHCVVFAENKNADRLQIDDTAIEHYRKALTDFQKGAPFDKDWGVLQENRPVFYCPPKNGSKTIGFFGQSPNFRIPYSPQGNGHATTVVDFIPEKLKKLATVDLADAIFGWVKKESEEEKLPKSPDKQRAGRVFVTDALYQIDKNGIWYDKAPLIPKILSEPKPTCFPHYLVQPEENNPKADASKLQHYASQPVAETVIRGHKLYWHQGSDPNFKLPPPKKVIGSPKKVSDTQTTLITPINRGVVFTFDIYFENLRKVEMGALLWVLSLSSDKSQTLETGKPGEKYCFSLGMGKPLGMGAVKIDYELYLSDHTERYKKLFDGNLWHTGEQNNKNTEEADCVKAFENFILDQNKGISEDDHPDGYRGTRLKEVPRIEMLLAMLRCDPKLDEEQTRYMTIDKKEYVNRPVLPTPLQVMGIPDNRRHSLSAPSSANRKEGITSKQATQSQESARQAEISELVRKQQLKEEQITEAKVTNKKEQGKQVTYEIIATSQKLTQREPKKYNTLSLGQIVQVKIAALREDGSIKSLKCVD